MSNRELISQPVIVIWVADVNAFLPLAKSSVLSVAANRAATADFNPRIIIAINSDLAVQYEILDQKLKPKFQTKFIADVTEVLNLIEPTTQVLFIHDAARPLTAVATFQTALTAVLNGAAASRPAHVVIDTLKQIDSNQLVTATIDRNSVQALTSPECYWVSSIDSTKSIDGWSFKLKPTQIQALVQGDLESIRVRCAQDVVLIESFLKWERLNHSSS